MCSDSRLLHTCGCLGAILLNRRVECEYRKRLNQIRGIFSTVVGYAELREWNEGKCADSWNIGEVVEVETVCDSCERVLRWVEEGKERTRRKERGGDCGKEVAE